MVSCNGSGSFSQPLSPLGLHQVAGRLVARILTSVQQVGCGKTQLVHHVLELVGRSTTGMQEGFERRLLLLGFCQMLLKQRGILYEDDIVQIGCKLETRSNLARLGMFYGNKTNNNLSQFQVDIVCPGQLSTQIVCQVLN